MMRLFWRRVWSKHLCLQHPGNPSFASACAANRLYDIAAWDLRLSILDMQLWWIGQMHWSDWGWETWWPEYDRPWVSLWAHSNVKAVQVLREFEHLSVGLDCDGFATGVYMAQFSSISQHDVGLANQACCMLARSTHSTVL